MPSFTQEFSYSGYSEKQLAILVFGTFKELSWLLSKASPQVLSGFAPGRLNRKSELFKVVVREAAIECSSEMTNAQSWDILKKNRKNVFAFHESFEKVIAQVTPERLATWEKDLVQLQEQTVRQEQAEAIAMEEASRVMKFGSASLTITKGIIVMNILVFLLMVLNGASLLSPSSSQLINWGADYRPLTAGGQWWRLLTAVFVHIGLLHLAFNMYALYTVGRYLEPILGALQYGAAYLATGLISSVTSVWWHTEPIVSAGASGAIFGLYGLFFALLTTSLIPSLVRKPLFQSIGIFVGYNLLYGMKSGVDNAAHVGGLISGFLFGYIYFVSIRNPSFLRPFAAALGVLALSIGLSAFYLTSTKDERVLFQKSMIIFDRNEKEALSPWTKLKGASDGQIRNQLQTVSLPLWKKNRQIIHRTYEFKLDSNLSSLRMRLDDYCSLRILQTQTAIDMLNGIPKSDSQLQAVSEKIIQMVKSIQSPQGKK